MPGVTTAALGAALDDLAGASSIEAARQRTDLLTQLISVQPLSSIAWLSLSGMRLVTGEPYGGVLAALKMSSITGPNEAAVMWQRGMFSLLQWDALPPEFQRQAILDISGPILDQFADDGHLAQIKGLLVPKSPQARTQIATMLQTAGLDAKALAEIGLAAP